MLLDWALARKPCIFEAPKRSSGMRRLLFYAAAGLAVSVGAPEVSEAQDTTHTKRDSLKAYQLGEIVVTAPEAADRAEPYTSFRVRQRDLLRLDPIAVSDFTRLIPGAFTQTNSRGETLIYLRDAAERQVAVFFDGALLNIPWDNRVDLSLVPANVVGGMTVAKGVPPIEYGTNVVGGALNLTSSAYGEGRGTSAEFLGGSASRIDASLVHTGHAGRVRWTAAGGHSQADGWTLPGDAALPFSQTATDLRTNTDHRITNVFVQGAYDLDALNQAGLSLLYVDADKGIAPESHLDPATASVRFWRYPLWQNAMAITSGTGLLGSTFWKAALWSNRFQQHIESYTSASYDSLESREEDRDLTFGGRVVLRRMAGPGAIKLAMNALTSTHDQRDLDLEPDGTPLAGQTFPVMTYRQHVVSGGLEYEAYPARGLVVTVGGSVDAMFAPKTGEKPAIDPFVDYSATLGAAHEIPGGWFVRGAVGRKTRFPTLRELFGESLNRFLINPDLKPESSILTEVGVGVRRTRFTGELIPFATFTSNTIDRRNVTLPGETRARRQRINLPGSRVFGVELVATAQPIEFVTLEGQLTLMRARPLQDSPSDPAYLAEKPDALGRLAVHLTGPRGTETSVEGVYTGRAYSLDEDNAFVALPRSLVLNVRVGQRLTLSGGHTIDLFVRGNNLTDEVVVPQLGLSAPGRSLAVGTRLGW